MQYVHSLKTWILYEKFWRDTHKHRIGLVFCYPFTKAEHFAVKLNNVCFHNKMKAY